MREMLKLIKVAGSGLRFAMLLLLRCPFDAAMTAAHALFLQNAFDAVAQNDERRLTMVCALYGLAALCLFLYNGTIWSIYAPFVVRMEGRLRTKVFKVIAGMPFIRMESVPQGKWLTRLNTDTQMPFSQPLHLPHAVCAIVNIAASATMLWCASPAVLGWVMMFVIPHIVVSQFLVARAMPRLKERALEATAANTSRLNAIITCADITAVYDGHDFLMYGFEQSSKMLLNANMAIRRRNALSAAILPLFGLSGYLVLLYISAGWIAQGHYTFGGLTAAFQYRGGILLGSMMLINSIISIKASLAGIRRLNNTLAEDNRHG